MPFNRAATALFSTFAAILSSSLVAEVNGLSYAGQQQPYFVSHGFPKPWAPQFTSWYPRYGPELAALSEGQCNATLRDYNIAFHAPSGSLEASQLLSVCYQHEGCVYNGLTTDQLLNFQSAAVILGFLPTLVSSIGVSISEIALLSAHRPVLSFLISLAAPAVWPTRLFEYQDPAALLKTEPGRLELDSLNPWLARVLCFFQYAVGLGAAINIFLASWEIGSKTILSWGCTAVFLPLLWTSLAAVPHIPAALSYGIVKWKHRWNDDKNDSSSNFWRRCTSMVAAELTVCANQEHSRKVDTASVPLVAITLNIIAGGLSFVYLFVGTVVFSSLVFISVWEVLNQILWRFVVSTAAARLILMVELGGLRGGPRNKAGETQEDSKGQYGVV